MSEIIIIASEKFSKFNELKFGFSTRLGGISPGQFGMNLSFNVGDERLNVLENRERFFGALKIGLDELAIPRQVQGGVVQRVYTQGGYDSCDGLITDSKGVFLTISTADCLPVFLFDSVTKSIGAVHAGWRGSEMNIVSRAIRMMREEFGTSPADLISYIAPAAGVCCYEVGEDVAKRFSHEFLVRNPKLHLNLKEHAKTLMLNAGVSKENIEVSEYCTICNANLFHSHRRDKEKSGRMMGVIGLVR